jgi:hypothetical protein
MEVRKMLRGKPGLVRHSPETAVPSGELVGDEWKSFRQDPADPLASRRDVDPLLAILLIDA